MTRRRAVPWELESAVRAARVKDDRGEVVTIQDAAGRVRYFREAEAVVEARVVKKGRDLGLSWARLGRLLDAEPETLRRRYGA